MKRKVAKVGDVIHDEMLGDVEVVAVKNGWPYCKTPPRKGPTPAEQIPVLTGELVEAVCQEAITTVSERWKVPVSIVQRWRKAIAGTDRGVLTALALKRYKLARS